MHLDLLRLDAVRAGEGTPEELDHVQTCAPCRGDIDRFTDTADALRRLPGIVPPSVDRTVLRRSPNVLRMCIRAAAAVLLAIGLFAVADRTDPQDVNRDGTVDIIDAYRLALKKGDRRDVEAIVQRCVKVAR